VPISPPTDRNVHPPTDRNVRPPILGGRTFLSAIKRVFNTLLGKDTVQIRGRIVGSDRTSLPLLIGLLLLVSSLNAHNTLDNDLWFDLRAGAEFLSGRFPRANLFSFSDPSHPWVNSHWLYDLLVYILMQAGGISLVIGAQIILWALAFILLWIACRGNERPQITAFVLGMAAFVSADRFLVRSEMVSYCWLAFYLALLETARRDNLYKLLWLIPPICLLWVNMHSYWLLGSALIWMNAAGALIAPLKLPFGWSEEIRWKPGAKKILLIVAASLFIIPIFNPYGPIGAIYPLVISHQIKGGDIFREFIAENLPPFREWGMLRDDFLTAYMALITISFFSCLLNIKKLNLVRVASAGLFLILSVQARRMIPLFAVISAPLLAENLGRFQLPQRWRYGVGAAVLLLMLAASAWAVTGGLWAKNYRQASFGFKASAYLTPTGAGDFIEKHRPQGPVFNDLDMGGYLAYRFRPDFRIVIDGRLEAAYSAETFRKYILALQGGDKWLKFDNEFHFGWVILNPVTMFNQPLIRFLNARPEWKLAYVDWVSIIFVRRESNPSIPEIVFPGDRDKIPSPPLDRPWGLVSLGQAFELLGQLEDAKACYRKAMALFPDSPSAPDLLGRLLSAEGRSKEALEAFIKAVRADSKYMPAVYDLGTAYLLMGYPEEARKWLEYAIYRSPGYIEARINLAASYDRLGNRKAAIEQYRDILKRDPGNQSALRGLEIINRR